MGRHGIFNCPRHLQGSINGCHGDRSSTLWQASLPLWPMQPDIASVSTDRPDQQKEITDMHNEIRSTVEPSASNMLKMKWDPIAADNAKLWAQECTFGHSPPEKKHANGILCGENIFMSAALSSWPKAIEAWHSEEKDFKYGTGSATGAETGHYTQVVWYKSYMVACAMAKCSHHLYEYFYVCHYCPAGNVMGENLYKPYKEGDPCGDCPNACDDGLCTNPCRREDQYSNCAKLKNKFTCGHPIVESYCPGSCQCTTEIQ
ncbi:serotriflin-like [Sphaerodactylus townsendi]|uniref:serotriflin-like n=1 Tax=Sphaerodactylus townsendi TaxID=933632 RepID=UPI00202687D0|nr:serotriflin-like [Sphaerodactylus townsendi]